jgi:hypothetical protein
LSGAPQIALGDALGDAAGDALTLLNMDAALLVCIDPPDWFETEMKILEHI